MLIEFKTAIAGHIDSRFDFAYRPGQVAEVEDSRALDWIASGVAVATEKAPLFTGFDAVPDPLRAIAKPSRKRGK